MQIGFHGDKNLIKVIEEMIGVSEFFVETGARVGRSLGYIADQFPDKKFRSCEINKHFYKQAVEKCESIGDVRVFNMDSKSFLESFWVYWYTLENPKDVLFWVDLNTHEDVEYESPFQEIQKITSKFNDAVLFIDDVKVPCHIDWFQYDSHNENVNSLSNLKKYIDWEEYTIAFPDYEEEFEEMYHPPVGWCIVLKDDDKIETLKTKFSEVLNFYNVPLSYDSQNRDYQNKFEFVTTACVRPELLDKTYQSLNECIVDLDTREDGILYINIDPVPYADNEMIKKEIEVARKHFSEVYYNIGPEGGSFPRAVKWCFEQPKGDYFFHIEDDWVFDGVIPIQEYVDKIENDGRKNMLQCVTYRNGGGNRVHFPPSIYKTETLCWLLDKHPIPEDKNPEQHIIKLKTERGIEYNVTSHGGVHREDIGRDWASKKGIERNFTGDLDDFVDWDLSDFND